jgi:general stress protein 26
MPALPDGDASMSQIHEGHDTASVDRLLAGARKVVADVRYCWLVSDDGAGGVNARPMGRVPPDADEDGWTIRFLADRRSRKVADIGRTSRVELIFQRGSDDAFVTLVGRAALQDDESEVRRRWKRAYEAYFPGERDRANAVFVEVDVERMELWIRGVTPEPFGLQTTVLEQDAAGAWRLRGPDRDAA